MAKKKQLQYQEMSLFDDSFFEDVSSKGDELLPVEQNKETPVKKKSEKQLYLRSWKRMPDRRWKRLYEQVNQ